MARDADGAGTRRRFPEVRQMQTSTNPKKKGTRRGLTSAAAGLSGLLMAASVAASDPTPASTQPDPVALPRTRQLVAEHKAINVVIYGDSISEVKKGWSGGAKTPEANWGSVLVKRLSQEYPGSTFTLHHFGIGGQNSYEGLGRLDGLEALKPDLVLLAFGANDCCYHFLIPSETKLALVSLATGAHQRYGADVLLLCTGGDNPLKPFFEHLDETIAAQREAAAKAHVPFVDIRAAVLLATENGKKWAQFHLNEGNCHPNDKGHEVWADAAFKSIQALVGKAD